MNLARSLEQKFLFPLTRSFALLLIVVLLLGIIVGGIEASGSLLQSTKVNPGEVMQALKPSPDASGLGASSSRSESDFSGASDSDVMSGVKIPLQLQKYFNDPHNMDILRGWLSNVPANERQEILDELTATVAEAEKTNVDAMNAINKYKELKFNKLLKEQQEEQELSQTRLYYVGAAFGCVTLIALFSLILVLLSIERNTRNVDER